jgi:hypothetical protein
MLTANATQGQARRRLWRAALCGACECSTTHLLQNSAQPVYRLGEPLGPHRQGKAEVTFARRAERTSGKHDDTGPFERTPGKQRGRDARGKRRPEVHGRHRRFELQAGLAERGNPGITAPRQLRPNRLHQRFRLVQCYGPGFLDRQPRASIDV